MPASVSAAFRAAMFAAESGDHFAVLLTLDHATFSDPIRLCISTTGLGVTSRGHEFINYPFDLTLPDSTDDAPPRGRLTVDNVSREIVQKLIRPLVSSPTVAIEVVRLETPDEVEISYTDLRLDGPEYDAATVSADLAYDDTSQQRYPADSFVPSGFPGGGFG